MNEISEQIQIACVWEATARKLGNVHRFYDFEKTTYIDFMISAAVIGDCFDKQVGLSVLKAVQKTQKAIGQNTNLGIALLLAPLVACQGAIASEIETVLNGLTNEDTRYVYQAIRLANPGGLGKVESEDVYDEPSLDLRSAMKLAEKHDQIAAQYANGFADILNFGVPTFSEALQKWGNIEAAIIETQIAWLAHWPDSLITRKNGLEISVKVQNQAADVVRLGSIRTAAGREKARLLNMEMRSDGNKLNPGTTADIIAAILFIALRERILNSQDQFNWDISREVWP